MRWVSLKKFVCTYNAFPERNGNNVDNYRSRTQILSTRIYIVLLFTSLLTIILTRTLVFGTTRVVTLEQPSLQQYNKLGNPQCSCSNIAIPYSVFISILPQFHSVCFSDFVTDQWINFLNQKDTSIHYWPFDFRASASLQFQALASFCNLSRTLIEQNLAQFLTTQLISIQSISPSILQFQVEAAVNEFKSSTLNLFYRQRYLIEQMIISNQLLSGQETNFIGYYAISVDGNETFARMTRLAYQQTNSSPICSCRTGVCQLMSGIYDPVNIAIYFPSSVFIRPYQFNLRMRIPGLVAACYPVQSLLLSTLECFYDQVCVNNLTSFISRTAVDREYRPYFTALKTPMNSSDGLMLNRTVESLVRDLMIEIWSTINISYENYYTACAPSTCEYYIIEQNNYFDFITTFLSFYGGLTIFLRLLVPWIVRRFRRQSQKPMHVVPLPPSNSVTIRLRTLITNMKQCLITLNIFRKPQDDPANTQRISDQRLSTRLFLFILTVTLCILTIYCSATIESQQQTIFLPTESQIDHLRKLDYISLSCPCANSSTSYSVFMSLEPYYHQVCSSIFVDISWITFVDTSWNTYVSSMLSNQSFATIYALYDFRVTAGNFFQTLQTLCHFAKQTISNSRRIFLQTQLISTQVMERLLFESKIQASIRDWQTATVNAFVRDQQLIRAIMQGNQIMAGYYSNFALDVASNGQVIPFAPTILMRYYETIAYNRTSPTCLCALDQTCAWRSYTVNYNDQFELIDFYVMPGVYEGCYQINALFQSTLECLYDQTCIKNIQFNFPKHFNESTFSILNSTLNRINETVESIVNRLMVDNWMTDVNFSVYFKACAPSFCTYEYTRHHRFTYLIAIILGIFGGLTTILRFFVPIAVKIYRRSRRGIRTTLPAFRRRLTKFLLSYNLFFKINSNEVQQQVQRQVTRFYIVALTMTLITVFLLLALPLQRKTVSVSTPSLAVYRNLKSITNLQCSCSHLAIPYSSFLSLKMPSFHQVCSSDFVSKKWISRMFSPDIDLNNITLLNYGTHFPPEDFRSIINYQFQLLAGLCQLANSTIIAVLEQLARQYFVNALVLPQFHFDNQISLLLDQLKQTTTITFVTNLRLIRAYMHNNALFTISASNWQFDPGNIISLSTIYTKPMIYGTPKANCSCALTPLCVQPAQMGDNVTLPGLMVGCFPLESLLQSTLELFYNQTLVDFIANSTNTTFTALTATAQYQPNSTTVESMISQLMVEQWESVTNLTSYENYYTQCSPSSCTYTYIGRQDLLVSITKLIAIAGGLSTGSRIIMPLIIKLILLIKRRRPQIHSTN